MKERYARACGLEAFDVHLPENSSEEQLLEAIDTYNNDPRVDGILLQLPIPKHLNTNRMLDRISPQKDADGLHPLNQGHMIRGSGSLLPCTPQGALRLLDLALTYAQGVEPARYDEIREFDLSGKRAVVIGRSILVGKPLALLLQQRNATVTMAHSKTLDLADEVSRADYVFAAAGSPKLIKGDWLRQHQIVIDVGTNRLPSGALCGDVDFVAASQIVAAITPVPGGVGPMTVANLVLNTLTACERSLR
jgi:methylenetetrahydrofolate dehydrogenase (NADP+)/methenyltetrahydrofolate cyclohydrolase